MIDKLFYLFSLHSEAVFAFRGEEIAYYNGAAETLLPDIGALKPGDIFPAEVLCASNGTEHFFGEAELRGKQISFACTAVDEYRVFTVRTPEEDAAPQDMGIFSAMSLELKDYLNILKTASGVVLPYVEDTASARLSRYAAMINKSYYNILRLAENMELLGRSEPGLVRSRFDLASECSEIITACADLTAETGIKMVFHSEQDCLNLFADRSRLRQLVLNLVSNSLLHTPPGGTVTLTLKRTGTRAVIQVSDTGTGIPNKVLQSVWNRYGEAKTLTDTKGGAGFGIAAVSKIARMHGGGVFFESRENQGTKFTVIIPVEGGDTPGFASAIVDYDSGVSPFLAGLSTVLGFDKYMQKYMD